MRRLLSDTGWTGLSHAFGAAVQLGLVTLVVRTLRPATYGAYATALAITALLEAVLVSRGGDLAFRYVGAHWVAGRFRAARAAASRIRRSDLLVQAAGYVLLALVVVFLPGPTRGMRAYLLILAAAIPAQIGYGVSKSVFVSEARVREQAWFEIGHSSTYAGLGAIGVLWLGAPGLCLAYSLAAAAKTAAARKITDPWWPDRSSRVTGGEDPARPLEGDGWLGFASLAMARNGFRAGSGQVDVILLALARGNEAVALYKVAKTVASVPGRVAAPLWTALRPRLLTAWHAADTRRALRLVGVPAVAMLAALVVSLPLVLGNAGSLLEALFGRVYAGGAAALVLLLAGAWLFEGVTAWFGFWVAISDDRHAGTALYGLLLALMLGLGATVGGRSITHMAAVALFSMALISVLCWGRFAWKLTSRGLHPPPATRPRDVGG